MGFIKEAVVIKADGREVLVEGTDTCVTLRDPMEATDHLLCVLDDGTRRILDPPRWEERMPKTFQLTKEVSHGS